MQNKENSETHYLNCYNYFSNSRSMSYLVISKSVAKLLEKKQVEPNRKGK